MATKKKGYGQFCPVAKAAEIVAVRWTPLVLRELLCGSRRFNDLRRGVPLMSPTLLSRRLAELEDAGIVERVATQDGMRSEYRLTPAGEALRPVVETLGLWGNRWIQHEIDEEDLDPSLLMWDIRRRVQPSGDPGTHRLVQFDLTGVPRNKRRWWLLFDRGQPDLCVHHPGHDVDLLVSSSIRALTEVWMGHRSIREAIRAGDLKLEGRRDEVRAFRDWFTLSIYAHVDAP